MNQLSSYQEVKRPKYLCLKPEMREKKMYLLQIPIDLNIYATHTGSYIWYIIYVMSNIHTSNFGGLSGVYKSILLVINFITGT